MKFSGEERVVSGTPGAGLNPWRNERFIDVGNYWLENILWPIYKRTMKAKYQQMSNRLNQCLVNITTVSSEDGISFIYGNIYALVKVGFYTGGSLHLAELIFLQKIRFLYRVISFSMTKL